VAGLYGAMRVLGKPMTALAEQRVLCVGAGSAGMGVCSMIASGEQQQTACDTAWRRCGHITGNQHFNPHWNGDGVSHCLLCLPYCTFHNGIFLLQGSQPLLFSTTYRNT